MKFVIADTFLENDYSLMRRCGYQPNFYNNNQSFLRKLTTSQFYPRFHLFLERKDKKICFNLHLDQKKPSYKGQKAHSGEGGGQLLNDEAERIINLLKN